MTTNHDARQATNGAQSSNSALPLRRLPLFRTGRPTPPPATTESGEPVPPHDLAAAEAPSATLAVDATAHLGDGIQATLDQLRQRLEVSQPTNIGFPATFDFDYTALYPFFGLVMNNLGDPYAPSAYPAHCKDFEREVVEWVADLLHAPEEDRWGYVTTGGTEGNLYALHLARNLYPRAVVYFSDAAHYSVDKAIRLLGMDAVRVRADQWGEIDYDDLARQVDARRHRPVVVIATAGTTITEAVDDLHHIVGILDNLAVRNRFVHVDAALAGVPLALLSPAQRPGFDFADGADSIAVSGHKFFGSPFPSGIVLVKASHRSRIARHIDFLATSDATISGSRSGHAALVLWYAIHRHGRDGLSKRTQAARAVAAYAKKRLDELGWTAYRHPHAFTVVLETPPEPVQRKWALATTEGWSHLIAMPGITATIIDEFISDLAEAIAPNGHQHQRGNRPLPT